MITKEFKLEKKLVIPMMLKNHTGMPKITGTFYVYDDEKLAKQHIDPTIFARLERSKANLEKKKTEKAANEESAKTEASDDKLAEEPAKTEASDDKPAEEPAKTEASDDKPAEEKKDGASD
jgi:ribosomal protein S24E